MRNHQVVELPMVTGSVLIRDIMVRLAVQPPGEACVRLFISNASFERIRVSSSWCSVFENIFHPYKLNLSLCYFQTTLLIVRFHRLNQTSSTFLGV